MEFLEIYLHMEMYFKTVCASFTHLFVCDRTRNNIWMYYDKVLLQLNSTYVFYFYSFVR